MYIFDETDGTLAHYGVKGMKWGVRKEPPPQNPNYSKASRSYDRRVRGKRNSERINKSMNEGKTLKESRDNVDAQRAKNQRRAIATAVAALKVYKTDKAMQQLLGSNYKRVLINNLVVDPLMRAAGIRIADRHARNKYADLMGHSGPMRPAKRSRSGAYKITNVR